MASFMVGVCAETGPGERRVAVVPAAVGALRALGARVAVEAGAGHPAGYGDGAYVRAGAEVLCRADVTGRADVLLGVGLPAGSTGPGTRRGQMVAGLLRPLRNALIVRFWAERGITAVSFDLLAEAPGDLADMDAAAQQARITGRQAVLTGLLHSGRHLPGSDTGRRFPPVRVLVAGGGPAGLQAAHTARTLGAVTTVCDTAGPRERDGTPRSLLRVLPDADIVVVTARDLSPGMPEVLVGGGALAAMAPGSVVVDTTAEPDGGSVARVRRGTAVTVPPGVTVVGSGGLVTEVAHEASAGYAQRAAALLGRFAVDGRLAVDLEDPLHATLVVAHRGDVLRHDVQRDLVRLTEVAGLP
ncbi:hypothetical protein [Streptomyces sp. NPDC020983]|uniref:hypothetical protein n=1 Tax=Streptomyces sp. NPDC020983 TaxID=3365106 RepID=UPI00378F9C90